MSANVESMMYNKENGLPWHKEGVAVDGLATSAEAISKAGLDWYVSKEQCMMQGGVAPVPGAFYLKRSSDDSVLGVCGERYEPLQNKQAFEWFDGIVGEEQAVYETAGSLKEGQIVWMLAKMPDFIRIEGTDDIINKYVLLTNSFNSKSPVQLKITPIRVVCNNTLNMALSRKQGAHLRIRHTKSMVDRMEEAKEKLGLVNEIYAEVNDVFNGMAKKKVVQKDIENYFFNVFGRNSEDEKGNPIPSTQVTNIVENELEELLWNGAGVDMPGVRGTLWHAYNAVTEWVDHYKTFNEGTDELYARMIQSGAKIKESAYSEAVKLLK